MKAEDLKNSILQLAMQGKLVPQNANDEPASVLLEKIKKEKEQLIKDKKIKKNNKESFIYKENGHYYEKIGKKSGSICVDDEIPFEIPDSWEWCKLGFIGDWKAGSTPKRGEPKYYVDGTIPWLKTGDLNNGMVDNVPEFITEVALKETSVRLNPIGSVLIAMYGATIGKVGILNIEATTNQACCACLPYNGVYNKYLFYYLMSQNTAFNNMGEGGAQPNISRTKIVNYLFPIPPLKEQKRIVDKIEELLPLIDEYGVNEEQLIKLNSELPKKLKDSILQEAVQGKLVPQDPNDEPASVLLAKIKQEKEQLIKAKKIKRNNKESVIYKEDGHYYEKIGKKGEPVCIDDEIPFEIPNNWEWTKINNIAFVSKLAGFEYTKYIAPNLKTKGIPLFKGKNIKDSKLILEFESFIPEKLSNELERSQLTKKCLLTPYVGSIGNMAIFDGSFKAHLGSNVGKIELFNENNCNLLNEYVFYYLKSNYGYLELTKHKKATAQESISITAIRDVFIPIPPLNEQKRIVDKIEQLLGNIDVLIGD